MVVSIRSKLIHHKALACWDIQTDLLKINIRIKYKVEY